MAKQTYRDGKVHVLKDQCATCIFRPGNLMHLKRGRVKGMVEETKKDAATITCHQTLDTEHAICRGWWDRYWEADFTLRLAVAMEIVQEVVPPHA